MAWLGWTVASVLEEDSSVKRRHGGVGVELLEGRRWRPCWRKIAA